MFPIPQKHDDAWFGQWIWGVEEAPRNSWMLFRTVITLPPGASAVWLDITADSAYELFINGDFVGRGPARGYPFHYFYDTYNLSPLVAPGSAIAVGVIANHIGEHTMGYMLGAPGLLCDIRWTSMDGTSSGTGSNRTWQAYRFHAMEQSAPRISKQFEFEEHFDARIFDRDWNTKPADLSGWHPAVEIGPVGTAPWSHLSPRNIPLLTENRLAPSQILAAEVAQPRPGLAWNLDVRQLAHTDEKGLESAVPGKRGWIIYSEIHVDQPCTAQIQIYPDYEIVELRINDQVFRPFDKFHPKTWTAALHAGPNLIMLRSVKWPALFIEADSPFELSARRALSGAAWVFSGPFDERTGELDARWNAARLEDLPAGDPRIAITNADNRTDIFVLTTSQRLIAVPGGFCHPSIEGPTPRRYDASAVPLLTRDLDALVHDNAQWSEIAPHPGGDIHLVIDFGREVVGYLEFDLDAAEGTTLDANGFEAIDDLGIYWMGSMRNTFRYVCREGRQTWRSHRRRGLRYLSLTIRNMSRAVRIRHINLYQSTYPVSSRGEFRSSDSTLNQIWETSAYTVQLCMLDTYVDCPGFEQVFWVGDARNSALVNAVAFGDHDLTTRCNQLVADSLRREIQAIVPDFTTHRQQLTASHVVSGWFDEIPMWSFLWVSMVWEHYLYTGDADALRAVVPAVRECLERAESMLSPRGLFAIENAWNMMDHAANDNERYGEIIGNSVMFVRALNTAAQMLQALDDPDGAASFEALAIRVRTAVNRYGWSEQHGAYVDTVRDSVAYEDYVARCAREGSQPIAVAEFERKLRISEQTNTLALLCGCVPSDRREQVIPFATAARNGKFVASRTDYAYLGSPEQIVAVGSPWFLFFTLETLFAEGYADTAFEIIRTQWKKMLDKGATTFWETFPGDVSKGHWSRSMCHGWSGAPAYFLSTYMLGVQPLDPGFSRIRIAPNPFDLDWASGCVPTPRGLVSVSWWRDESGTLQVKYAVPEGCQVVLDV